MSSKVILSSKEGEAGSEAMYKYGITLVPYARTLYIDYTLYINVAKTYSAHFGKIIL